MAAVEEAAAVGGREYGKQWYRRRSAGQEARESGGVLRGCTGQRTVPC